MTTDPTPRSGYRGNHDKDADRRAPAASTEPRRIRGILRWPGPRDEVRRALDREWAADK